MKQRQQRVMAKANNIKLKEADAVVVGPETTASSGQQTIRIQNQSISTAGTATQSNFILVRAARSDSGQLILQNGHELLTLLNESAAAAAAAGNDDNKPIVIQQRKQTRGSSNSNPNNESTNSIAVHHQTTNTSTTTHSLIKTSDAQGGSSISGGNTILLQSSGTGGMKKLTSADGSSIILQQTRLATAKNSTNDNSGPILLQTLKRLDKTPSILVIRNAGGTATAGTSKMVSAQVKTVPRLAQQQQQETVTVITSEGRERSVERVSNSKQTNVPLGSGKYNFPFYVTHPQNFLYKTSCKSKRKSDKNREKDNNNN